MIKLILITYLASGGYIEVAHEVPTTFEQCVAVAESLAAPDNSVYCVETPKHEN